MNADPYRNVANIYDRIFEPLNSGLRGLGTRMLPPHQGMNVLDVGCGTGIHLSLYQKIGCNLFGIDTSLSMLDIARKRLGGNADIRLGDAARMPYDDKTFDLILCMLVLHEMEQSTRMDVISEMKRTLKSDGHILLIDFHAGPARPLKGWLTKSFIYISELAAGRRNFRNYRHFISIRGLPSIIAEAQLKEKQQRIVAGGALALYLTQTT